MSIRVILHNAIAAVALTIIVISLLVLGGALLNGAMTLAKGIWCAAGFFGGEAVLKVIGEYEW